MFKGVVLTGRIELPTPSLPRKCSTTELRQPMSYSLTKGYCVKKLNQVDTARHLKHTELVDDTQPRTRSGVTSHAYDTPDSTIQRLRVTDSESSVLERCVKEAQ